MKNLNEVEDFMENVISRTSNRLKLHNLPEYAQEDGRDIMNNLRSNLEDCRRDLLDSHSLEHFRDCAHQQLEDARSDMWELQLSLVPSESSNANPLPPHLFLILFNLILGLFPLTLFATMPYLNLSHR